MIIKEATRMLWHLCCNRMSVHQTIIPLKEHIPKTLKTAFEIVGTRADSMTHDLTNEIPLNYPTSTSKHQWFHEESDVANEYLEELIDENSTRWKIIKNNQCSLKLEGVQQSVVPLTHLLRTNDLLFLQSRSEQTLFSRRKGPKEHLAHESL